MLLAVLGQLRVQHLTKWLIHSIGRGMPLHLPQLQTHRIGGGAMDNCPCASYFQISTARSERYTEWVLPILLMNAMGPAKGGLQDCWHPSRKT